MSSMPSPMVPAFEEYRGSFPPDNQQNGECVKCIR